MDAKQLHEHYRHATPAVAELHAALRDEVEQLLQAARRRDQRLEAARGDYDAVVSLSQGKQRAHDLAIRAAEMERTTLATRLASLRRANDRAAAELEALHRANAEREAVLNSALTGLVGAFAGRFEADLLLGAEGGSDDAAFAAALLDPTPVSVATFPAAVQQQPEPVAAECDSPRVEPVSGTEFSKPADEGGQQRRQQLLLRRYGGSAARSISDRAGALSVQ